MSSKRLKLHTPRNLKASSFLLLKHCQTHALLLYGNTASHRSVSDNVANILSVWEAKDLKFIEYTYGARNRNSKSLISSYVLTITSVYENMCGIMYVLSVWTQDWNSAYSKGCFFFEEDGSILSHLYSLRIPKDTSMWITVEPYRIKSGGKHHLCYYVEHYQPGLTQ